ncbi:site-specific integrase [Amycolatopsis sp. NPDC049688]|uniref:site-specific integrase n=1 Tax=Amycolatopsis sp. NPDC049688 TaxID=3154733 RepID=UPI00341A0E2D
MYKTSVDVGWLAVDGAAVLDRAGIGEGMPFVLEPDGSYDVHLNRFIRELATWGARSEHTRAAYARDLMLFGRFLHQHRGGRSIWHADQEDLRAYKRARRRTPGFEVSASTWNRFIAALDKWVAWAMHERLLDQRPFRLLEKAVFTPTGPVVVLHNAERELDEESTEVRFLSYEDYLLWRDVGLRGQLPSGAADPPWRGRHGERNAVFADLLVCTGMRLQEASSLLVTELPLISPRRLTGDLHLAATVTKRRRARTVYVSRRVLHRAGADSYLRRKSPESACSGRHHRVAAAPRVRSASGVLRSRVCRAAALRRARTSPAGQAAAGCLPASGVRGDQERCAG